MSKQQQERTRLTVPQARELAEAVVRKMNYTPEESAIIAEHVIDAGLCGYEYSGLPKLLDAIESKRNLRPRTPMKIIKETPEANVKIDSFLLFFSAFKRSISLKFSSPSS